MGEKYNPFATFLFLGFCAVLGGFICRDIVKNHNNLNWDKVRTESGYSSTNNLEKKLDENLENEYKTKNKKEIKKDYSTQQDYSNSEYNKEIKREKFEEVKDFSKILGKNMWVSSPNSNLEYRVIKTHKDSIIKKFPDNRRMGHVFYIVDLEVKVKNDPIRVYVSDFCLILPNEKHLSPVWNYDQVENELKPYATYIPQCLSSPKLGSNIGIYSPDTLNAIFYYGYGGELEGGELKLRLIEADLSEIFYLGYTAEDELKKFKVELGRIKEN